MCLSNHLNSPRLSQCRSSVGNEFHRCGPAAAKHWSLKALCKRRTTYRCVGRAESACVYVRDQLRRLPNKLEHCRIDTGRPGQRPRIGLVVTWATSAVVAESTLQVMRRAGVRHVEVFGRTGPPILGGRQFWHPLFSVTYLFCNLMTPLYDIWWFLTF